jgi:predicted Rossmann fold flavoprotein
MTQVDVCIVGAGAAGLHCAAYAASMGKSVVVLEHNDRPGKKIRISGGGRCNFTNRVVTHHHMISANPDFARSALARYTPDDFIALVDVYGIAWHEKKLGQLFCDESAQQIIDMLIDECSKAHVDIQYGVGVESVTKSDMFTVSTTKGAFEARSVVVATGGLSIPTLGASDLGYRIAAHFDHPIVSLEPALVPLTFDASYEQRWSGLSGISVDASVSARGIAFRENLLFTHRGLSGPAILQISSYIDSGDAIMIDVIPDVTLSSRVSVLPAEKRHLATILHELLPQRFLDEWNDPTLHRPVNATPKRDLEASLEALHSWTVIPKGTEGYAKAEVTRGGVDTRLLSSKTMESTRVPGLFFIGEVVDVTGWLGGYNFQWAWSSAVAAGTELRER